MKPETINEALFQPPRGWRLWWLAARPRTLSMSLAPVLVGSSLAWAQGAPVAWPPLILALLCAVLIQIGTNLHNDCADFERGNDGPRRLGPVRVTAAGWATPKETRRAAHIAFGLATLLGAFLVWLGGWPILALGLASVASGYAYSGGPRPISHTPLGELFVLAFFGLTAVCGSSYLQAGHFTLESVPAGLGVGAIAAAVLMVNNLRDVENDSLAGRRTLAAVLGRRGALLAYAALLFLPFACVLWLRLLLPGHVGVLVSWLALPLAISLVRASRRAATGAEMNELLVRTAQAQVPFAFLLSVGLASPF
ncbi:MAG: 1,4-dihydroxy-2-naphthoate polyprenyltransferase [Rhodocyclaceae bacterium]|nr:1,4-dihydroxy-2-naphthoate polyprenyltransferase [Rhodocyclaceae bacterium]